MPRNLSAFYAGIFLLPSSRAHRVVNGDKDAKAVVFASHGAVAQLQRQGNFAPFERPNALISVCDR